MGSMYKDQELRKPLFDFSQIDKEKNGNYIKDEILPRSASCGQMIPKMNVKSRKGQRGSGRKSTREVQSKEKLRDFLFNSHEKLASDFTVNAVRRDKSLSVTKRSQMSLEEVKNFEKKQEKKNRLLDTLLAEMNTSTKRAANPDGDKLGQMKNGDNKRSLKKSKKMKNNFFYNPTITDVSKANDGISALLLTPQLYNNKKYVSGPQSFRKKVNFEKFTSFHEKLKNDSFTHLKMNRKKNTSRNGDRSGYLISKAFEKKEKKDEKISSINNFNFNLDEANHPKKRLFKLKIVQKNQNKSSINRKTSNPNINFFFNFGALSRKNSSSSILSGENSYSNNLRQPQTPKKNQDFLQL